MLRPVFNESERMEESSIVPHGHTAGPTTTSRRCQPSRKVTLIDLERFFDLWVEEYRKLPDEDRRCLPLQPIYFLAPEP